MAEVCRVAVPLLFGVHNTNKLIATWQVWNACPIYKLMLVYLETANLLAEAICKQAFKLLHLTRCIFNCRFCYIWSCRSRLGALSGDQFATRHRQLNIQPTLPQNWIKNQLLFYIDFFNVGWIYKVSWFIDIFLLIRILPTTVESIYKLIFPRKSEKKFWILTWNFWNLIAHDLRFTRQKVHSE